MATRKKTRAGQTKARQARRSRPKSNVAAGKRAAKRAAGARRSRPLRRAPETLRLRSITPGFTVNDLQRSLAFYTDVLGLIVGERWTDDGGQLRGVMLKAGACRMGLSQDDWAKGRDRKKGEGVRIWCQTRQDIDALAARIKSAGVALTEEPRDQPWGGRSLAVDDPDGFHLTVFREP